MIQLLYMTIKHRLFLLKRDIKKWLIKIQQQDDLV